MGKTFEKPSISLGGVFLDCRSLSWPLLAGTASAKTRITVTKGTAQQLMALENPVELKIIIDVFDGVGPSGNRPRTAERGAQGQGQAIKTKRVTKIFKNLHILEIKAADNPWWYEVEVGDQRHFWEKLVFSREYNIHKSSNVLKRATFGKGRASQATQTTFTGQRYAPWSLKNVFDYRFANSVDLENEDAEPWTAQAVAINILEKEFGLEFGGTTAGKYILDNGAFDTGYQVEGLSWEMSPTASALSQVLATAQSNIYQHPDGGIVLYSTTDTKGIKEFFANFDPIDGAGWPVKQDLSKVRPGKIRAIFSPVEYELRFDFSEGVTTRPTTVSRNIVPFTLQNVIQLPDDLTVKIGNNKTKKYVRGSWIPIKDAVVEWGHLDGPGLKRGEILTRDKLLKNWFADKLEWIWTKSPALVDGIDPVWSRRIKAIREHYRQTFMIDPVWMNRIRSWRTVRAAILDPVSGIRQPSPVFVDYCEIPSFRLAVYNKNRKKFRAMYNVTGWSEKIDDLNPSPFTMRVLDQDAGIFKIQFAQDQQQLISGIIPSKVKDIPFLSVGISPKDLLLGKASLFSEHHLSVIISVVLAEPNDETRHHILNYTLSNSNKKKTMDLPIRSQGVRYKWTDTTKAVMEKDQILIKNAELVNGEEIQAIADAEVKRLQETWEDLIIGQFTQPGYKDWVPMGSMRSVTVKFSKNRGLETSFNMTERPPKLDIYNLLPQSVRKLIYKQLSQ